MPLMLLVALAAIVAIGVTTALAYDGGEEPAETRGTIIAGQPASGTSVTDPERVPQTRDSAQILAWRDGVSHAWLYPPSQSAR